ncbi:hypothetical protein [Candidatus Albibeggiatoa sp. nov. NOAA]|uniref:hypothetical protein n=1 Tax=Candidatus Albibeggiatoa sp. nov. NOAA TaxID=3162724 RepID=UPI0032F3E897|nr:hypothetical protein [Thiotrichaceae bacterium]
MKSSLYKILNIAQNANQEQIKQAAQVQIKKVKLAVQKRHYRFFKLQEGVSDEKVKIAAQLRIQRIKKAYNILSSPSLRKEYDERHSQLNVKQVAQESTKPSNPTFNQNSIPKDSKIKLLFKQLWISITIGLSWFFGLIFSLAGIGLLFERNIIAAFAFLVSGFLLLPPSQNWFYNQFGNHIHYFLAKKINPFINKKKIRINWVFSLIFLLIGMISVINISVAYGVMTLMAGLLTLPPIQDWIYKQTSISFNNFLPRIQLNTMIILPLIFIVAPIGIMLTNFEQYRHDMAIEQQQKEKLAKFQNELNQALIEVHTAFGNKEYKKVEQITTRYKDANDEEINTYHEEAKKQLAKIEAQKQEAKRIEEEKAQALAREKEIEAQVAKASREVKELKMVIFHENIGSYLFHIMGVSNLPEKTRLIANLKRKGSITFKQDPDIYVNSDGSFISKQLSVHEPGDHIITINTFGIEYPISKKLKNYYGNDIDDGDVTKIYHFSTLLPAIFNEEQTTMLLDLNKKEHSKLVKGYCYVLEAVKACGNLTMNANTKSKVRRYVGQTVNELSSIYGVDCAIGFRLMSSDKKNGLCQKAWQRYGCNGSEIPRLIYNVNEEYCEF